MKKYDVTLTAHYRKTVCVYAESPEQAKKKTKIILWICEFCTMEPRLNQLWKPLLTQLMLSKARWNGSCNLASIRIYFFIYVVD